MTLWHFPSKNSKDSFRIADPEFSKSETIILSVKGINRVALIGQPYYE